jgi:hypothetical protein
VGGGGSAGVAVGAGREAVGRGVGDGVALGDGVGGDDAIGLTTPCEGEADGLDGEGRDGDALADSPPAPTFASGLVAGRKARSPEPAIVRINPMRTAHCRRRMSEAYGEIAAVAPPWISQSRNSAAASRSGQLATDP